MGRRVFVPLVKSSRCVRDTAIPWPMAADGEE